MKRPTLEQINAARQATATFAAKVQTGDKIQTEHGLETVTRVEPSFLEPGRIDIVLTDSAGNRTALVRRPDSPIVVLRPTDS